MRSTVAAIAVIAVTWPHGAGASAAGESGDGCIRAAARRSLAQGCGGFPDALPNVRDTPHFHIRYATIVGGLTIEDYVAALEEAWSTLVERLQWAPPPVYLADPAPGGRYPVSILPTLMGGMVAFDGPHAGWVGDNPATPWDDRDARATCLGLTSDFSGFAQAPLDELRTTAAHELFHALQAGIGALEGPGTLEPFFRENSAQWAVSEVFPATRSILDSLWPEPEYGRRTCLDDGTRTWYTRWLFLRSLSEPFGVGVSGGGEQLLQDFVELASREQGQHFETLELALASHGVTLAQAVHEFAVAAALIRPCSPTLGRPWCFDDASTYVAAMGEPPAHRFHFFNDMSAIDLDGPWGLVWGLLPAEGPVRDVTVTNASDGGELRASLLCDRPSAVKFLLASEVLAPGRQVTVRGHDWRSCTRGLVVLSGGSRAAGATTCEPWTPSRPIRITLADTTPQPVVLRLARDRIGGADVQLEWTGSAAGPYRIERGSTPTQLDLVDRIKALSWTDPAAVAMPPELLFYQVN